MKTRQLSLPLHQIQKLITGEATRLFVRMGTCDAAALTGDGWLITDKDGYVRFATGDHIVVAGKDVRPNGIDRCDRGHVCTLRVTGLTEKPLCLAKLTANVANRHGYASAPELWQDYAFMHDHACHKHWMYVKRCIQSVDAVKVFASLITSRDRFVWTAWELRVSLVSVNADIQQRDQAS